VVGTCFIFPYIGNVIIPTDELHHFSEGVGIPPTSNDIPMIFDFLLAIYFQVLLVKSQ
jgi:hypothetical protein